MDSAYHNPRYSFLLLCCLCLKSSSFLQCLQQHPQQCGPHDAGLSLPPHCVAQGHPPSSGHGDERYLHPGRKRDCLGLSGGKEGELRNQSDTQWVSTCLLCWRVESSSFFPPVQKGLSGMLMFLHTSVLCNLHYVHTAVVVTQPGPVKTRRLREEELP